jgi:hypothetical protein
VINLETETFKRRSVSIVQNGSWLGMIKARNERLTPSLSCQLEEVQNDHIKNRVCMIFSSGLQVLIGIPPNDREPSTMNERTTSQYSLHFVRQESRGQQKEIRFEAAR